MPKTLFIFLLMMLSLRCLAQADGYANEPRWKTAPLSWYNIWKGPNINIIHERFIPQAFNVSVVSTAGVHFPLAIANFRDLKGGFGKLELRFYQGGPFLFFGIEMAGGYQTFTRRDSIITINQEYVSYHSERSWLETGVNLGFSACHSSHFLFEFYLSVGGRYYNNNVALSDEDADNRDFGDWTVPRHYREMKGTHFAPKITMNFKIGFWTSKKNKKNN